MGMHPFLFGGILESLVAFYGIRYPRVASLGGHGWVLLHQIQMLPKKK